MLPMDTLLVEPQLITKGRMTLTHQIKLESLVLDYIIAIKIIGRLNTSILSKDGKIMVTLMHQCIALKRNISLEW